MPRGHLCGTFPDNRADDDWILAPCDSSRAMTARVLAILLLAATATAHGQQSEVRIRAARVIDGTGKVLQDATVVVVGSRISAIESPGLPSADIDLGSVTLLPGLIDVHSHIGWHFGANGR